MNLFEPGARVRTPAQPLLQKKSCSIEASAPQSALGADEAAARFGANGPLTGATADDYPGPNDVVDRVQGNDGHFVNVTATLLAVLEPGTVMLLKRRFAGLAASGTRKRS